MAAPTAFTAVWRVQAKRQSLVDDTLYYLDMPAGVSKQAANEIASELRVKGLKDVKVILVESIP